VIVGVHTPEFSFEHLVSNIKSAAMSLGVYYPIAVDNNYVTWSAYNNNYWPADYPFWSRCRSDTETSRNFREFQ